MRTFPVWFLAALSSSLEAAEIEPSRIEFTVTRISGPVYMLQGPDIRDKSLFNGGNIAVLAGNEGLVLVDSKIAPVSENVSLALDTISSGKPRFLINTHHHNDHVGGNAALSAATTTIIAHDNVRSRLKIDKPEDLLPILTFSESLSLHINDEEIKAIHVPDGHTDSDVIVYFTHANVVHMGDYLFTGMFPVVDLKSGGNVQGYLANIEKVLNGLPDDVKIIPGHGALSTLSDLRQNYRMLLDTTALVKQKMHEGKSLEDIKREGLQEEWGSWAWWRVSQDEWIETIYYSYSNVDPE
jgi:glyoxylase-like metal-dependent hydrolase (beta-lactamase superfamily II)